VLDELALDGVLYENAITSIPITLPSHSSMMTGKVPFSHGVRDNGLFKLPQEQTTLAEILKKNGYNTAATVASFPLTSQFGIDQGFDYFNDHVTQKYEDVYGDKTIPKAQLFFDERNSSQVNEAIMPWIEENYQSPFFVWFHYFDPHHPHEPPAPYNQEFINDLYQGEIAFSDESLGNVISQLKRLNIYDNSLIIFTSDHGEGNNEHNESTHSLLIYNSTLHVPLIIKYPKQEYANTRIKTRVGLVDLLPTVLNILNIESPEDIQGQRLPLVDSPSNEREIYAETLSPRFSRDWGEQRGLIKNGYKYIYGPNKELYNLDSDPNEINNIIETHVDLANSMKQDLQNYIDEYQNPNIRSSIEVDSDTLNTLRGLGYVQSSGGSVEYFEEKLNDQGDPPQLHIDTISTYSHAKNLLFQEKYIQALSFLDALLLTDSDNLAYLELKIQAEIYLGNYKSAKNILIDLPPDTFGSIKPEQRMLMLAKLHLHDNELNQAKMLLFDAENYKQTSQGQILLAKIFLQESNPQKYRDHLETALSINTGLVTVQNDLAISYSLEGNTQKAEELFENAIASNPYHQLSIYNYGVFLNSLLDFTAAELQFKKAIKLQPNYLQAHYALIETQLSLGKIQEAKKSLKSLSIISENASETKLATQLINNYESYK
jgi:arylsulfatase A-like enzyme/Tfp pilus assembly protein PilF